MAKILAISSQVVYGPVGLNAIVPALQAEGHEVLAVPTVLLSNHPGHGKPAGGAVAIEALIEALDLLQALHGIDAVITGYFASVEQIACVAKLIEKIKPALVLVDPVMGDHGKLYVSESVAAAIRDLLVPLATIITPNAFELSWLTGLEVGTEDQAKIAASALKVPNVLATSIPESGDHLATLEITAAGVEKISDPKLKAVPNGTGDFLAGLYLARQFGKVKGHAFADAHRLLRRAIVASGDTNVLAVAEALT